MKKTYNAPETKVYKVNIGAVICTSPTEPQNELKDDIEGQLSRDNENGVTTSGGSNIWSNEW